MLARRRPWLATSDPRSAHCIKSAPSLFRPDFAAGGKARFGCIKRRGRTFTRGNAGLVGDVLRFLRILVGAVDDELDLLLHGAVMMQNYWNAQRSFQGDAALELHDHDVRRRRTDALLLRQAEPRRKRSGSSARCRHGPASEISRRRSRLIAGEFEYYLKPGSGKAFANIRLC
jgi:hypothetical protein